MFPVLIDLLVDGLATYRLTRLATADTITQPARDRVIEAAYLCAGRAEEQRARVPIEHEGDWQTAIGLDVDPPKWATLVTCRWCAGMWIAAGVVVARAVAPTWWERSRRVLALSAAAALIAGLEQE